MSRPVKGFDTTTIEVDGAECDVVVRWTYYPEEAPSRTSDGSDAVAEIDAVEIAATGEPVEIGATKEDTLKLRVLEDWAPLRMLADAA